MSTLSRTRSLALGAASLAVLLSSATAYAQAPMDAPMDATVPAAPAPATAEAPAAAAVTEPAPPPEAASAEPAMVEESIDPALLGGDASGQLSAEELEKLGFGGGSPSVDTDIKVFGFADFTFMLAPQKPSNTWRKATASHSTFFVGNFNLYLTKNLSENVRTMSEVRFHYTPHGMSNVNGAYVNNSAGDHADFNRAVHLGGIEIERIYLEWTIHPYLTVRTGQFLTPYGIWNVDHGSPLFIPVMRPYVIGSSLFPERQTGFEFLGRYDASNNSAIGYHFTLSNGMGPISEIKDLDENKGVGARLFWEYRRLGTLRVGGSAFYAKDTALTQIRSLDASGQLVYDERIDLQSKVLSFAMDLQWRYKGLHLQFEAITQQRKFVDGGRVASTNPYTGSPISPQDYLTWGVYGLAGYGFDVGTLNIMPYVLVQSFDQVDPTFFATHTNGVTGGVNIRPIDAVVVKLAYVMSAWPEGSAVSDGKIHLLQAQVAWAF